MADFVAEFAEPEVGFDHWMLLQPTTKIEYGRYRWMDPQGNRGLEQRLFWKA